jgi:diacylglycerol kinase family enzyme
MDRITVIANPSASQFTGGAHRDVMATLDKASKVEALWPSSAREASELSRKASEDGVDIVVAMGGDGMVHHVAQPLVGSDTALGIVPVGTTNVVARLLGVPSKPAKAARLLVSGREPSRIGVARMELRRGTTATMHHALFACGFGFDANVVARADKDPYRKYRFGSIHYLNSAVGVALTEFPRHTPHLEVSAGANENLSVAALVQFRSIYTYFGRIPLRLAPDRPDPMTVLTIDRLPRHKIPQVAANVFAGRDLGSIEGFETWPSVTRMELAADPPVATQADGESLGMVDGAIVDWLPDSLNVIGSQTA